MNQSIILLFFTALILITGCTDSSDAQTQTDKKTDGSPKDTNHTPTSNTTNQIEQQTVKNNTQVKDETQKLPCPNVTISPETTLDFGLYYDNSKPVPLLSTIFVNDLNFSAGWELINKPPSPVYFYAYGSRISRSIFYCRKGEETGENINNLYCLPSRFQIFSQGTSQFSKYSFELYEPKLIFADSQGNVIITETYIQKFVFDLNGMDIQNVTALNKLKPEAIVCSKWGVSN